MTEIICLNGIIRFHCSQPAKSCSISHPGICKLQETSMNWLPTSSTRARGSEFILKPVPFVLHWLGFWLFWGVFYAGEGRGLKKERGESGEKAAGKAGLTRQGL